MKTNLLKIFQKIKLLFITFAENNQSVEMGEIKEYKKILKYLSKNRKVNIINIYMDTNIPLREIYLVLKFLKSEGLIITNNEKFDKIELI